MKVDLARCFDQQCRVLLRFTEYNCHEGMSVLDTHEVVEDGVECGREVVEET